MEKKSEFYRLSVVSAHVDNDDAGRPPPPSISPASVVDRPVTDDASSGPDPFSSSELSTLAESAASDSDELRPPKPPLRRRLHRRYITMATAIRAVVMTTAQATSEKKMPERRWAAATAGWNRSSIASSWAEASAACCGSTPLCWALVLLVPEENAPIDYYLHRIIMMRYLD